MATLIFWLSLALIGWTYVVYPLGMVVRARRSPRRRSAVAPVDLVATTSPTTAPGGPHRGSSPRVSVVVAVRDGAPWIEARIDNLFAQDYPADLLDVIIVCNGSADGTEALARARARIEPRLTVLVSPAEEGKAGALNAGVAAAGGRVVVFADVRQRFDPDAVAWLVTALAEPGVGAATGRLIVGASDRPGVAGFSRYWELETVLRLAESETGSVVGATGAIYAVWKRFCPTVPPGTLLDDVYIPARVVLAGERVAMEPRALARDEPTASHHREYRRRVRTLAGNLQLVRLLPQLLRPRNPLFIRFISHKLLRVFSPLFFLGLVITGFWIGTGLYLAVAIGLVVTYAAGIAGLFLPHRALALPSAFVMVHAAAFHAMLPRRRSAASLWTR